ncbi:MAG: HU family DNA-binding protein [Bacteroidales bacterium]|nr:HU family DNA-binding protein [Bacteroidales bacterium]
MFNNFLNRTNMNKAELVKAIAAESGLSKKDSEAALNAVVASVTKALKDGDKVALIGFGTFSVVEKAERKGVNPATKKEIVIPAKKVVKFKAGAGLEL